MSDFENVLIGHSNLVDECTLSGGAAVASLPLTHLQTKPLGRVWRSTNLTPANTLVNAQVPTGRAVRMVGLINHNLTLDARYRLRGTGETTMTNLLLRTEDFTHAVWTAAAASVASNLETAPSGAATADRILTSAGSGGVRQVATVTAGQLYTLSAFVMAGTFNKARLRCASHEIQVLADLTTGECVTTGAAFAAGAVDVGGGWWRVSLTFVATLASINWTLEVAAESLDVEPALTGTPSGLSLVFFSSRPGVGPGGSIYAWGAQLELGNAASSYYPSAATQGVRSVGYMDGWQSYDVDTGWLDVWPQVYPFGSVPWGANNWWSRTYTEDEIRRTVPRIIHDLGVTYYLTNWRLELDDDTNGAGYVQAGRLFMGQGWQPLRNMDYGLTLGWVDPSTIQTAISGQEYSKDLTPYRQSRFVTSQLSEDEGMANGFEIMGRMGITGEVLLVLFPSATVHLLRQSLYGRLAQLSDVEFPYGFTTSADGRTVQRTSIAWSFKEKTR